MKFSALSKRKSTANFDINIHFPLFTKKKKKSAWNKIAYISRENGVNWPQVQAIHDKKQIYTLLHTKIQHSVPPKQYHWSKYKSTYMYAITPCSHSQQLFRHVLAKNHYSISTWLNLHVLISITKLGQHIHQYK